MSAVESVKPRVTRAARISERKSARDTAAPGAYNPSASLKRATRSSLPASSGSAAASVLHSTSPVTLGAPGAAEHKTAAADPAMVNARGATSPSSGMVELQVERRALLDNDVDIRIVACGICHSDLHHKRGDWGDTVYPVVPGHEIVGFVVGLGRGAAANGRFAVGDPVAVGNMVDSCRVCENCDRKQEQYCLNGGPTWVYNGRERIVLAASAGKTSRPTRTLEPLGAPTYGGYSTRIVCDAAFVLRLPAATDLARRAPLLCAGITVYAPLLAHARRFAAETPEFHRPMRVAIVGLGGLGHLGVQFAAALGMEVHVISTSPSKRADALVFGARQFVLSTDEKAREAKKDYYDLQLSTIPYAHEIDPYLEMARPGGGTYHVVGNMNEFLKLTGTKLVFKGKRIDTSNVGGIAETQAMLDFAEEHSILATVKVVAAKDIDAAMQDMQDKKMRYRAVLDLSTL